MRILKYLALGSMLLLGSVKASGPVIKNDEMWSTNGGVFQPSSQAIPEGVDRLLVKSAVGDVRLLEINPFATNSELKLKAPIISVDRTPPQINSEWKHVIAAQDHVVVGPDSELTMVVEGGEITAVKTAAQVIKGQTNTVIDTFKGVDAISVTATDEFDNTKEMYIALQADFQPPQVSWQLAEPAVRTGNGWFAGSQAQLMLDAKDDNDVASILINDKPVIVDAHALNVRSGDKLTVVDQLGNGYDEELRWQKDEEAPFIVYSDGESTAIVEQNISVKVNAVFELAANDDGVGLTTQKYKGVQRKWLDLPKKFRFTSKGYYRIKVLAEDKVGNVLEKNIKVKAKR